MTAHVVERLERPRFKSYLNDGVVRLPKLQSKMVPDLTSLADADELRCSWNHPVHFALGNFFLTSVTVRVIFHQG